MVSQLESGRDEIYTLNLRSLIFPLHHPAIFQVGTSPERIFSEMFHPVLCGTRLGAQKQPVCFGEQM